MIPFQPILSAQKGGKPITSQSFYMGFLVVLFVAALFLLCCGLNEEGTALLSLKNFIKEDPNGSLINWNSSDRDPCNWNGITCKQEMVVSLSLPKNGLLGSLPSSLGSLTSLRHINLRSNRLYGSLPSGLFKARSLQSLVLYGNFLSGSLPSEIGTLSALQILDLSYNLMNGSIPISLLRCKRLKALVLSHNNFSGALPFGLGTGLSALEMFDVSYNRLSGSIPDDIGNLSSLQGAVDLSHNFLSGSVPASIGNLPEKVYIDLSYNNLSGPIPQNGSLINRGPAGFIGNPGLCGPPLKNSCMFPPAFNQNPNGTREREGRGVKRSVVTALIVSDVAAICLVALVFFLLYRRAISSRDSIGHLKRNKYLWFWNDNLERSSENGEKFDLVPLDKHVRFNMDELLQSTAFVLGKSSNGIVYKVVMEDGLILAVRRLGEGGQQRFKEFRMQVKAIGKVRHTNIVALRAYYWSIEEKLLVYDYIPNGNLSAALHGKSGVSFTPMPWRVRLKIMKGIAKGLAFLHGFGPKKNVHGNLKPGKILLGLKMEPYISDFGLGHLAYLAEDTSERQQGQLSYSAVSLVTGSLPYYQPPEAFQTLKPSQKWDVYSYGVILLEMISGRSPEVLLDTMEMDLVQWFEFCINERKPTFDVFDPFLTQEPDVEDEIISVLKIALACVESNPERRPSMRQVKETLDRSISSQEVLETGK